MKYKIYITTLLILAVVAMGAVSAYDGSDVLSDNGTSITNDDSNIVISGNENLDDGSDENLDDGSYENLDDNLDENNEGDGLTFDERVQKRLLEDDLDDDLDENLDDDSGDDYDDDSDYVEKIIIGNSIYIYNDLPEDATGQVTIYVDDTIIYSYDPENTICYNLETGNLTMGTHNLRVLYSGDDNYLAAEATSVFNITFSELRAPEEFILDEEDDNNCLTFELPNDVTGIVKLLIDGVEFETKNANSYVYFNLKNLNITQGNHTFKIKYQNGNYPDYTEEFTAMAKYLLGMYDSEIEYNGQAEFFAPMGATGEIKVLINGEILTAPIDEGLATINFTGIPLGEYHITVKYDGDGTYPALSEEYDVRIVSFIKRNFDSDDLFINDLNKYAYSITLPANATGELAVYKEVYNEEEDIYEDVLITKESLEDGYAQISLINITKNCGDYDFTIRYVGDDYEVDPKSEYLRIVEKINVTFSIDNIDHTVKGHSIDIYNYLPEDATGQVTIYVDETNIYSYDPENTICYNLETDNLTIGTHNLRVVYSGDDHYLAAEATSVLNITFSELTALSDDFLLGEYDGLYDSNILIFELPSDVTGIVKLIIDGVEFETKNADSEVYFNLKNLNLTQGNHTFKITYQNGNYPDYTEEFTAMAKYLLDMFTSEIEYNGQAEILVPMGATGEIKVLINGEILTAPIDEKGWATINFTDIPLGEYPITVKYDGDGTYPALSEEYDVKIVSFIKRNFNSNDDLFINDLNKYAYSITLPDDATGELAVYQEGVYKYVFAYSISLSDDATGELALYRVKEKISEDVLIAKESLEDGYAQISLINITRNCGDYDFIIKYLGDDYEVDEEYESDLRIRNYKVSFSGDNYELKINDNLSCNFEFADVENGALYVYDEDDILIENISIINGKAEFTINQLGFHFYTFRYNDEEFYDSILVWPESYEVPDEINDTLITVTLPDDTNGELIVFMYNKNSNVLINQSITYTGGKAIMPSSKFDKGVWMMESFVIIDSKYGNFSFYSTPQYIAEGFVKDNIIISAQSLSDVNSTVNETNATETDSNNTSGDISDVNSTVNETNATIVDSGNATVNVTDVNSTVNETNATDIDSNNTSGNTSDVNATVLVDPKIVASNLKLTYSSGSKYKITVYGSDGKLASNVEVKITGKIKKTLKTSTKGVASFKVTKVPGKYKIKITSLGKSVTKTITVKHIVTLKKVSVKKSSKKLVLTATLAKVNGKYLKAKKITFKFNGKKYKVKTNKKGVAKVTINKNVLKKLKIGKKIKYQATYLKDTVKYSVKVKK